MKIVLKTMAGIALSAVLVSPASALISVESGTGVSGFANDDFGLGSKGVSGLYQGGSLRSDQRLKVTFEVVFSEAAWSTDLVTSFGSLNNKSVGSSITGYFDKGELLDFAFNVSNTGRSVSNADNLSGEGGRPSFAIAAVDEGTYYLGLNDDGGLFDMDYDDFVTKLTIEAVSVPEPGSLALLGLGIVGIGLTRMRQRQRQALLD